MKKSTAVLSALFLVLVLSSGAFAARALLTGADIKDGSLTGVDIKSGSLGASLLTASAKSSLRGAAGTDGAEGATGQTGVTGLAGSNGSNGSNGVNGLAGTKGLPGTNGTAGTNGLAGIAGNDGAAGANGTVTPLAALQGLTALATASPPVMVVALDVPAGHYVILAKTQLSHTGAGDSINCTLKAGATTLDQIAMKTLPALAAIPASLQAVTTVGTTTTLSVQCAVLVADGAANFSSLIALPTS
jgi:hypothetical protein